VAYYGKLIVHDINWQIRAGEFWQLKGPNGSGKTTLISLITGDNPHAYGQDLWLFGRKKGSGESIWDIKSRIGYFTPQLLQQFSRQTKIDEMIISGLYDSIGLYTRPTDNDKHLARQWLGLLGIEHKSNNFHELSPGMQRLVMVARALIKQPDLLILDEPSTELDDHNVQIFVGLVNAIAKATNTAIIYVSHNNEPGLKPQKTLELQKTNEAYTAIVRE
jgi:molybdate transport system ATP-binding protein